MHLPVNNTIVSGGSIMHINSPIVMGILNATPDSFYNKGVDSDLNGILRNAGRMLAEGASILDVGGASTRPGQPIMGANEEWSRLEHILSAIVKNFPDIWLSIDTYNSVTAKRAVEVGVRIINDVSAGNIDPLMKATVAQLGVPYIAMHMQGTPETMQKNPAYNDVVHEVLDELRLVCDSYAASGVKDIIVDPGFGFGKTLEHNYALLKNLNSFKILGRPILAGISRKSIVCKALNVRPADALNGTTALHMVALQQGADILRVHDVKEAMEVIKLYNWVK